MPIVAEKLTYDYSQGGLGVTHALKGVDLTIPDGCVYGIIGHTGSGKSTLVQHFNGLLQPHSGRVLVDSLDASDKKLLPQIRQKVGMVFQYPEYQLFEETVFKDVAFGPMNHGVSGEALNFAVNEALLLVGLEPDLFASKSPFELSGGEKRRVALAGVLSMHPKALVLDEPMAGMDPQGRELFSQLIRRLKADGRTLVVVSHHMDEIAEICDYIAVLNEGEVVLNGTPSAVFADLELLSRYSLDAPFAALMAHKLRERGFRIQNAVTVKELGASLIAELKRC